MASTATLVIDMLNPYEHEDADRLAEQAAERIEPLTELIGSCRDSGSELIYVNDNYEDFTATSKDIGETAMNGRHPELIEPLLPLQGAQFVQKVRHSAFYQSALGHLLEVHEIETLVLSGQVTEQCILYTALDAYLRGFTLRVAEDAVVPIDPALGSAALRMMERNMGARIAPVAEVLD